MELNSDISDISHGLRIIQRHSEIPRQHLFLLRENMPRKEGKPSAEGLNQLLYPLIFAALMTTRKLERFPLLRTPEHCKEDAQGGLN